MTACHITERSHRFTVLYFIVPMTFKTRNLGTTRIECSWLHVGELPNELQI